jgi:hypothetical protein
MDNLGLAVHTDVRFHPEIPLIAFLGLMHVRITALVFVLGRRRGAANSPRWRGGVSADSVFRPWEDCQEFCVRGFMFNAVALGCYSVRSLMCGPCHPGQAN